MTNEKLEGFLLTRHWRDTRNGLELTFWAASDRGPLRIVSAGEEAVFFVERRVAVAEDVGKRQALDLLNFNGKPVDGLYFTRQDGLTAARSILESNKTACYESDIKPVDRFLMERFICGAFTAEGVAETRAGFVEMRNPVLRPSTYEPKFRVVSLDIETEGLTGALYSIAIAAKDREVVFMIGEGVDTDTVKYQPDELKLMRAFLQWMREYDPDIIIGWNVIEFDLAFLANKCKALDIEFALGRNNERAAVLPARGRGQGQSATARVPGRVVLDGIDTLRASFWNFESFSLEFVANELLGRGKLIVETENKLAEIQRLFAEDKPQLAAYNLEDCRLVLDIAAKTDLIGFAEQRARLTGLPLDRVTGSVAAFEFLYLPRLHRQGYVAPDVGANTDPITSPGGYVLESTPGLFDNVLVLDFKSLYPSIIRTFLIDPLGLHAPDDDRVEGFIGASFSRNRHILPGLIETLWAARDEAKRVGNKSMSQAIKIIMNSFYGVLGTPMCRFYDPKLATSITKRGHEIITRSRDYIESHGYRVIYGDTDSVFVLLGSDYDEAQAQRIGGELAAGLNTWWRERIAEEHRLESFLEVQFETNYFRFLMPTIRGSEVGTKKRYCGAVRTASGEMELVFRGLESVRGDWTPLAKAFQRELYRRVFANEPYESYVSELAAALMAGELDEKLVYRKRLRREIKDYTKNVPPHVRAARKLASPGNWVSYLITIHGPEPVQRHVSPIDYGHYLDRQLAPVADAILHFLGTSFETITQRQMEMF